MKFYFGDFMQIWQENPYIAEIGQKYWPFYVCKYIGIITAISDALFFVKLPREPIVAFLWQKSAGLC
jgi:hypothetical protein